MHKQHIKDSSTKYTTGLTNKLINIFMESIKWTVAQIFKKAKILTTKFCTLMYAHNIITVMLYNTQHIFLITKIEI